MASSSSSSSSSSSPPPDPGQQGQSAPQQGTGGSSVPATIEREDDILVVRVGLKTLDDHAARRLQDDVSDAVGRAPGLPVVMDLSAVKILPSITLGTLVRMHNQMRQRQQRLLLSGLQPAVRGVMSITRLDRLFEIHDDLPAALRAARAVKP